jgi:hypothetical protein
MTFFVSIYLVGLLVVAQVSEPSTPIPDLSLKNRLQTYFSAEIATDRSTVAESIGQEHKFEDVLRELKNLDLWGEVDAIRKIPPPWVIELPSGQKVTVQTGTAPKPGAQPAVIQFSAQPIQGAPAAQTGMAAWMTVSPPVGGSFALPRNSSSDLPLLMREIRKLVHLDRDRIYLFGDQEAADAAWIAGMQYPAHFAGLIVVEGVPRVPYPDQLLALLLPNLRHVPCLSIWIDSGPQQPNSQVAVLNKAMAEFATKAGMSFETATLAASKDQGFEIPLHLLSPTIKKPRPREKDISHCFRYLPQGNAGWLRATELSGDVWEHDQISIATTQKEDRDAFITQTLKDKLFHLAGKIEGQLISIETQRIGGIEVRLSPDHVDFSKPVAIRINGRARYEGMLESSVTDLLESAYEDWDLQHPVHIRKQFSIHAR